MFLGGRYVVDAELRSRRIVDTVQYASVDFIKAFWSVAETGKEYWLENCIYGYFPHHKISRQFLFSTMCQI